MNVNYNSLSTGRDTLLKNGIGDSVGSPPISNSKAMRKSWLVMLLFLLSMTFGQLANAQSIVNYAFSTSTTGSLEDLSSGATTMLTGANDDAATAVFPIGFDFWFMGVKYTHFSANSNGQFRFHTSAAGPAIATNVSALGANTVTLAAMSGDNEVNNGMRFRVDGTAPNRKLIIEWNQFYVNFVNLTNAGNMQAWMSETTGKIDFVYGEIYNSATSSQTRSIFISSSNTATTAGSITIGAAPVFTPSATLTVNTIAAGANPVGTPLIANLGSAAQGSRVVYSWTPPSVAPSDPTSLTFSVVTATATTANWVDNSTSEIGFLVTRALDAGFTTGLSTSFVASTTTAGTGTAYTSAQIGLTAGNTYFYKVAAVVEGAGSAGITGSQATTAGATYYWVGVSGSTWGTAANWNTNPLGGGSVRTTPATTDILIVDGAGFVAGGSMIISHNVAAQTIGQLKVTSNTTLSLQSDTTTTRTTTISGGGGDDLVVEAGSTLQLINAANACAFAFSGTGTTGLIAGTYNAAGSTANLITTTGGIGTLVTVTGSVNNNIAGSSGCLTGSAATLVFAAGSNYLHGSFTTTNGFIPLATWDTTSTVTITGGTTSTAITNPTQSFGNFVYNTTTSTGTMSVWTTGTTAVIKGNLTITATGTGAGLFRALTSGTVTVNGNVFANGGTLQIGNGTTSTNGIVVLGNTTVGASGKIDMNSAVYSQRGPSFTLNGTLTGTAAASALNFFSPTNVAQTLSGTGTVLTNIGSLGVQNTSGLTISTTNPITTLRVNLFNGTITGSNLITLGTGAALNTTVQTGYAGNVLAGGSFNVAPTFNLGTGTHGVIYAAELGARTTGLEIPSSRLLGSMTSTNANGVVVAGGNLSTGTLTFGTGTGNITTDASNVLTVTGTTTGSIVRTSATAFVNGPLEITLPASLVSGSTYSLPVGKSAVNPFALVNPTTNAGGSVVVRAEAFDGNSGGTPGFNISAISTTRYWGASITSGAANFTSSLIQLNDTSTGRDAIAASATQGGAYDIQGGVAITTTATSLTTTAPANTTLPGFFLMANKAAASLSNLAITPTGNSCSNLARTVTVDVTPGGAAVTSVVIDWSLGGVAQTPVTMTATTSNGFPLLDSYTGVIPSTTPSNGAVVWSVTATDGNALTKTQAGTGYQDNPLFGTSVSATNTPSILCPGGIATLTGTRTPASILFSTGTGSTLDPMTGATQVINSSNDDTPTAAAANIGFTFPFNGVNYTQYSVSPDGWLSLGSATATSLFSNSTVSTSNVPRIYAYWDDLATGSDGSVKTLVTGTAPNRIFKVQWQVTVPRNTTGTSNTTFQVWLYEGSGVVEYRYGAFGAQAAGSASVGYTIGATNFNSITLSTNTNSTSTANDTNAGVPASGRIYTFDPSNQFTWAGTDLYTDAAATVAYTGGLANTVYAKPSASTTYTATWASAGCTVNSAPIAVTLGTTPSAPAQVVFDSTCGVGAPLVSVSDPNAFTTPTFKWYDAAGTTLLQSNTATTYLASISSTTTFQVSVVDPTSGCESAKTTVVAFVLTPNPIETIANQTVCVGTGFTVTAVSAAPYTYTWTATGGAASGITGSLAGPTQTITPTTVGSYTYTVSGTDGVCSAQTTFTATVNAYPVLSSAVASPAAVCTDGISTLTASVPSAVTAYPFTGSTGAYTPIVGTNMGASSIGDDVGVGNLPIGFTFNYNGVGETVFAASSNGFIQLGNTSATISGFSGNALATNAKILAAFWDDNNTTGGSIQYLTTGTTPNRVLTVQWTGMHVGGSGSSANPTLDMQIQLFENGDFRYNYGPVSAALSSPAASIGYSVVSGTFRSMTPASPASASTSSTVTENTAATAVNLPSGTIYTFTKPVPGNVTWAPLDDLYTDALATTAYTGTNAAVVYSKPTVTRTYNATLSANGCDTVSGAVTVTQNGETVAALSGPTTVCIGDPTVANYFSQVGATYISSNPAVATIDIATGDLTTVSAGTTVISSQVVNETTGCTSLSPNTVTVVVSAPIAVTGQPTSQTVLDYDGVTPTTTNFSVTASGSVSGYRWQESPTGNVGTWTDILDGNPLYTGQATATLSIANATIIPYSGTFYRCVVSAVSPCATPLESASALLIVSDLTTTDPVFGAAICGSGDRTVSTVSTPTVGVTYQWFYAVDNTFDYQEITGDFGGLTFPSGTTGASLEINGLTTAQNGWYLIVVATYGSSQVTTSPTQIVVNSSQTVVTTGPSAVQDVTVCLNSTNTSTFTVSATGGSGYQWQYSVDGSNWDNVAPGLPVGATYTNPTGATLTVNTTTALTAGPHYYRCRVAGPAGCPAIDSNTAQLNVTTTTITAVASVPTLCGPGGSSVLTASGAGVGGSYAWTAAATLAAPLNLDTVTATPTATTTYTVTGTTAAGCIATGTVTVTVAPAITAAATATPSIVCSGTDSQLLATYTPVAAANPSNYAFVGSTGTYTPITGGTATTASGDDGTQFPLPIGFNFTYNGTVFTDFGLTTNGHIRLGAGAASFTNAIGTNANILAPLWDDNHLSAGNITYQLSGTSGSQVLTVQWANVSIGGSGSTGNSVNNFQIQLFEGSNVIKFNYGGLVPNALSASIGISGASGNFLSVTPGSPASASTVSSVTANNSISSVANLPTGTSYTFTPPVLPTITYSWSPSTFLSDPNIANPIATAVTTETTYTLTVTSSTGCSDTEVVTVGIASGIAIVGQPQDATFCEGTTASLSIGATGAGLIYQWRRNGVDLFGEINSSITIPAATPANSGNYDVVINDACGGAPVTSTVAVLTIVPTPTVNAISAQTSCAGATPVVALSGNTTTFNISGGAAIGLANATGVSQIPSFTGIAGSATITVTPVVTSGATTCNGTATTFLYTINASPATPTAGSNSPGCDGLSTINLTASPVSISGYSMNASSGVAFVDISATGTDVPSVPNTLGDDSEHAITIPSFTYNGVAYTSALVGNNGAMAFGVSTGTITHINTVLPATVSSMGGGTGAALMPFWDDLLPSTTVTTSIKTQTIGSITYIQWTNEDNFNATGSGTVTFQVQLDSSNGKVHFVYPDVIYGAAGFDGGGSSTVGIQLNSTQFVQYSFNTNSIVNGQSITFTPNVASYAWTGPNGFTSSLQNPSLPATALAAGVYSVKSINVSTGCESALATTTVVVDTPTTWYADADADGFGDLAVTQTACTQPVGYVSNSTDCDPLDGTKWQFATFYVDADADGYDNGSASVCSGVGAPAGYSATTLGLDCDDTNAAKTVTYGYYTDADLDTYGAIASVVTQLCTAGNVAPSGYSVNNLDCDDSNAALNPTNPCPTNSIVNLTLFMEGYYLGGSTLNSVKFNQDGVSPTDEVEDLTINLHDATTYALMYTATATLKTDGTLSASFTGAPSGSFYVAVKGSNVVETWSADPQTVGTTALSYDFSSAATQAYGSNMREIEPGVFAFYQGDINQDGSVDNSDYDQLFPDIENSAFGVQATDLNGDGAVDNSDTDFIPFNVENSIFANYPF